MMKKNIEGKLADEVINECLEKYLDEKIDVENNEHIFSKNHELKMKKLFNSINYNGSKINLNLIKKVAIILIGIFIVMNIAMPNSIHAWKEKIEEFFIRKEEKYTMFVKDDNTDNYIGFNEQNNDVIIENFGYIPDEYTISSFVLNNRIRVIKFVSEYDNFQIRISRLNEIFVDNENNYDEEIEFGNYIIYYSEKDDCKMLLMNRDNYSYFIYGNMDKDKVMKILQQIDYESLEKNL